MSDTDVRHAVTRASGPATGELTVVRPRTSLGHGAPTSFRPDIEGLRAIAVLLVVAGHAGIDRVAGGYVGVDVFFVISGFLITTLLVKEAARTGTISLRGFYARRMMRLLPASTVLVLATVAAGWLLIGPSRWGPLVRDALSSVAYAVNWRLAAQGTDYLQADVPPSPLQHLWSLAVEEQFYVVWPLLVLAVWRWRSRHGDQRRALVAVLAGIVVVSLGASVWQTATSAPYAYFGAHTRAWELATGALLALSVRRVARLGARLRAVLAWAGLAAIAAAAVTFDERTAFPGYVALLPVLGTAAAIAGGTGAPAGGPGRVLGSRPFLFVGGLSYSWYLWHWPVLVLGPTALDRGRGPVVNATLVALSLALAWLSFRFLEGPLRAQPWLRARPRRGLVFGLALSASVAVVALVGSTLTPSLPTGPAVPSLADRVRTAADPRAELTAALTDALRTRRAPANMVPALDDMSSDSPRVYADGCHVSYFDTSVDKPCVYGDPAGTRTLFLVGDSHAAHWFRAFDDLAKVHRVRLVVLTKSGCHIPAVSVYHEKLKRTYTECPQWRDWVLAKIVRDRPDAVVLASSEGDQGGALGPDGRIVPAGQDDDLWLDGWRRSLSVVRESGARVTVLLDTPWPKGRAPECLTENARALSRCTRAVTRAAQNYHRRPMVAQVVRDSGAEVIDPLPWFCVKGKCPLVVGNTLVYKDNSHMTSAYAAALEPLLDPLVPWGPGPTG